ncbi:hypothetical protein HY771_00010 [Candidatus Uhrbacteria bacterium]|nr:hypothetical protein [Candidatus Uhrbacteria bacterium]
MLELVFLTVALAAVVVAVLLKYRDLYKQGCSTILELRKELKDEKAKVWTFAGVCFSGVTVTPTLEQAKVVESELSTTLDAVRKFLAALDAAAANPTAVREDVRMSLRLQYYNKQGEYADARAADWQLPGYGWYVARFCHTDCPCNIILPTGEDEAEARRLAAEQGPFICSCGNYLTEVVCRHGHYKW